MNKQEIIKTLEKYNLDKEQFVIISGAAMVINNIKKETEDIDIAVTKEYNDKLINTFNCTLEREIKDGGILYKAYMIDNIINFSTHYYGEYKDEKIKGLRVQNEEEILKLKQKINREKDKKDIELLKKHINKKNINILSLAYLGDAVYELYIRNFLIDKNLKVNELQKQAINYVSAKSQSAFLDKMIKENFLEEKELEIIQRGRNHKSHSSKTTDIITYKKSTGLEALIGYLKVVNNTDRIKEIMKFIVGE